MERNSSSVGIGLAMDEMDQFCGKLVVPKAELIVNMTVLAQLDRHKMEERLGQLQCFVEDYRCGRYFYLNDT